MTWLGLIIGNSRFHWAVFQSEQLRQRWDTPHCSETQLRELQRHGFSPEYWQGLGIQAAQERIVVDAAQPELWAASVVEGALAGLETYSGLEVVQKHKVNLGGLYETLGIDRALSLLGAGEVYGWPVLVVDCGTALTFTAGVKPVSENAGYLLGGAILPGLSIQFRALHDYTDRLPWVDHVDLPWPGRWEMTTEGAIASGILHTQLAGIRDFLEDWWLNYPGGKVILTGGDGETIFGFLKHHGPELANPIHLDPDLMFWGLRTYRQALLKGR